MALADTLYILYAPYVDGRMRILALSSHLFIYSVCRVPCIHTSKNSSLRVLSSTSIPSLSSREDRGRQRLHQRCVATCRISCINYVV